jgi:amidophosphoribosyltransferase
VSEGLQHHCGIAAVYYLPGYPPSKLLPPEGPDQASRLIPMMLLSMQNRGQLAAGISTYREGRRELLMTYKDLGTVQEVFRMSHPAKFDSIMRRLAGPAAIGHVRYATCGQDDLNYAQPFERQHGRKWKWFAFAFNGQIANYPQLRHELLQKTDYHLSRDTDTEILMHRLSYELRGDVRPDLRDVFQRVARSLDGAYNVVFLNASGELVVARDPLGIRPLCYAVDGGLFAAASESVALVNLGFEEIHPVQPGEMIIVSKEGLRHERFATAPRTAHCFFEWIYFANAASSIDGRSVYQVRAALGRELARYETLQPDEDTIIVPVPDTAKPAADAMAHALGLPSVEGLLRNRYVGRTFIEGQNRAERARLKYTPVTEVLAGKRVILVEDTIVRSTTMRALIEQIRQRGKAREVHVRVACPPIVAPCFYGIDMSTVGELFAPRFLNGARAPDEATLAQMAAALGADSLRYLPLESIARAIGMPAERLCQACLTGEYPTPYGQHLYQIALRKAGHEGARTYEALEVAEVAGGSAPAAESPRS